MRNLIKVFVFFAMTVSSWFTINLAIKFINQPSDVSVVAGFGLLLGLIGALLVGWRPLFKAIDKLPVNGDGTTLCLAALMLALTGCTTVPPGYVGIVINQVGHEKGVSNYTAKTGRFAYNVWTEKVYTYPTFVQTAKWTKGTDEGNPVDESISWNTRDNMAVAADVSLSYQINADDIPGFYVKFRSDNIDTFTHGFLRNLARDAFNEVGGTYTAEEVNSTKKEEFLSKVKERLNGDTKQFGVVVEQFGFLNSLHFPKVYQDAIDSKVAAVQNAQRAENELRQATAEAAKAVAKAKGEAEANLILTKSLTPELLMWRQYDILDKHWDGKYPQFYGGGMSPLISLPGSKETTK